MKEHLNGFGESPSEIKERKFWNDFSGDCGLSIGLNARIEMVEFVKTLIYENRAMRAQLQPRMINPANRAEERIGDERIFERG